MTKVDMTATGPKKPTPKVVQATAPIYTADDFRAESKRTILYLGPEKTGKTHSIMSWLECGPMLLIYFDSNTATMEKFLTPECVVIQNPPIDIFEARIIPAIQNRNLARLAELLPRHEEESDGDYHTRRDEMANLLDNVETVAIDTASSLAIQLISKIAGGRIKIEFDDRQDFLNKMRSWFRIMVQAARPVPNRNRTYNILVGCHEWVRTDEKGNITEVSPKVEGQFRNEIAVFFDSVLYCMSETSTTQEPGKPSQRVTRYVCHTVPPDSFRRAGDGVGGGRYNVLPPKLEGTYPSLAKAWGLKQPKA